MNRLRLIPYAFSRFRGVARIRAIYWYVVRGYETEVCHACGRPVRVVWTAPDEMWERVMGGPGGIRCPPCFADEYRELTGKPLRWIPTSLGGGV